MRGSWWWGLRSWRGGRWGSWVGARDLRRRVAVGCVVVGVGGLLCLYSSWRCFGGGRGRGGDWKPFAVGGISVPRSKRLSNNLIPKSKCFNKVWKSWMSQDDVGVWKSRF
jgi:hypothetical protein